MKRYDKDGKAVGPVLKSNYGLDRPEFNVAYPLPQEQYESDLEIYENALTPQQMAEKIKELEKEVGKRKAIQEGDQSTIDYFKNKLKDSQQEVERLKEGLETMLKARELWSAPRDGMSVPVEHHGEMEALCSLEKMLKQLLETKQKQEG